MVSDQESIAVYTANMFFDDYKTNNKKTIAFSIPEEFQSRLDENASLKTAFEALTPGRQRGYLLPFSKPKQSKTRASRVEKCITRIFLGKGLNDR